jgi:hypothetical protein
MVGESKFEEKTLPYLNLKNTKLTIWWPVVSDTSYKGSWTAHTPTPSQGM